jgi:hypothetical protein
MPLAPGNSNAVKSENIREMRHAGYPEQQAIAAALSNARRHPHASNGGIAHLAAGGYQPSYPPFFVRQEARDMDSPYHPGGFIESDTAGRTDRLPYNVAADSFVMPADVVSGLGQGNSLAGARIMDAILGSGAPYGAPLAGGRRGRASGGAAPAQGAPDEPAGVILAGGEYLIHRAHLERFGHRLRAVGKSKAKTDLAAGHEWARDFVKKIRAETKRFLAHAPEPKR